MTLSARQQHRCALHTRCFADNSGFGGNRSQLATISLSPSTTYASSSGDARPIRFPIRSTANVRIWLIFCPGTLWELCVRQFQGQWKTGSLHLARQCYGNHGSRTGVEDIVAEYEYRP